MNFFLFDANSPLLFTQTVFWVFLLGVMFIFGLIKNKIKLSHIWLLLVSYFFYYKSSGNFVVLLLSVTLITFFAARLLGKIKSKPLKKFILFFSILLDASFLLYFKYTYFFIDLVNQIWKTDIVAIDYLSLFVNNSFGTNFSVDKIILPVGISFFTFQAISYLADVYKEKVDYKTSFLDFAFYLSFFPQLVAGPIVRAENFLPQLKKTYSISKEDFNIAFFLILNGLIKKIFVSDYISINFVDRVFASPDTFSGVENLFASYGYTLQIYCDFSGYTDIAIAISLLFGFRLPKNFDSPYKAVNITEFWHRWHISLSTWLRDYIYIPLGGNRKGKIRQYINLLATMLIGGFWHGANLKFVFWGFCHGVLLIIDKLLKDITKQLQTNKIYRIFSAIVCFHLVATLWIFFRADSFENAYMVLQKIFSLNLNAFLPVITAYWKPLSIIVVALVIHILPLRTKKYIRNTFYRLPLILKIICALIVVFVLSQVKSSSIQPFIYFQF